VRSAKADEELTLLVMSDDVQAGSLGRLLAGSKPALRSVCFVLAVKIHVLLLHSLLLPGHRHRRDCRGLAIPPARLHVDHTARSRKVLEYPSSQVNSQYYWRCC
jgi:hypothetical protein